VIGLLLKLNVDEEYKARFRRRTIEKLLSADLQKAQEAFRLAASQLAETTKDVPSAIPASDCNLRIARAGMNNKLAYGALQKALKRWKDFVASGVVPEDLLEGSGERPVEIEGEDSGLVIGRIRIIVDP
jgi:hypothetical protein